MAFGSCGAIHGARTAAAHQISTIAAPRRRLRGSARRAEEPARGAVCAVIGAPVRRRMLEARAARCRTGARAGARRVSRARRGGRSCAHPRVDEGRKDVDRERYENGADGEKQGEALDEIIVAAEERVDEELAEPRDR